MKGSVRRRGKTWTWYLDVGRLPNGQRKQVSKGASAPGERRRVR